VKLFILLIIYCFFFSCSRIGIYSPNSEFGTSVIDHPYDSIGSGCEEGNASCERAQTEDPPFLRARVETGPNQLTEYFTISSRKGLEILLVIDASDSMNDNLRQTGKNMRSLLSHIQDKDWRMAFITADHGDHGEDITEESWQDYQGSLPRFGQFIPLEQNGVVLDKFILTNSTPGYEQIFEDTISHSAGVSCSLPPYCQGVNEQPLRALKASISRYQVDAKQRQFFQPNTDTVVLIITDEDERRNDFQNATTAENVIQTYNQVFSGQKKRLFGFSISIQTEECYQDEKKSFLLFGKAADYGHIVGRLADQTGGSNVSICSKNYGASLEGISKITRSLVQSLFLQEIFYIPKTVKVALTPHQPDVKWRVYGRKIIFSNDIKDGTQVKIDYRYETR